MKIKTKTEIALAEKEFQKWQSIYDENEDKEAWDNMWFLVEDAVSNMTKKKLKGVKAPDFEGKVLEITCNVMEKIQKGERIDKLSSYIYFPIIGVIYNKKTAFYERAISLEHWQENNGDVVH